MWAILIKNYAENCIGGVIAKPEIIEGAVNSHYSTETDDGMWDSSRNLD